MSVTIRSATRILLFLTIVVLALSAARGQVPKSVRGSVCTGFNGTFYPRSQEKEPTYYTVGDSEKFFFDHPGTIALDNLDLDKTHALRVFEDGELAKSWNLRLDHLKVRMVTIWRSPGYWHLDPTPSGKCSRYRIQSLPSINITAKMFLNAEDKFLFLLVAGS